MFRWLLLLSLILILVTPAYANGGMALVYGTFQWRYWLLYVAVTVLFEAYAFGRWAKLSFGEAVRVSIGANLVTGLIGAVFSGLFGYMVYSTGAKSYVEPNPLGHALFCLGIGGTLSALIESIFWAKATERSALLVSLLVHLAGIPLALMILLVPPRPYSGLEGQANFRRHFVRAEVARSLRESLLSEVKPYSAPKNWEELVRRIGPMLSTRHKYSAEVVRVAGFTPDFSRFDIGEAFREPAEFNPTLAGKDLRNLAKADWLVRWGRGSYIEGIAIRKEGIVEYAGNLEGWLAQHER